MFIESNYRNISLVKHHIIVFPQHGGITREGQIIANEKPSVIQGALVLIIRLSQTTYYNTILFIL